MAKSKPTKTVRPKPKTAAKAKPVAKPKAKPTEDVETISFGEEDGGESAEVSIDVDRKPTPAKPTKKGKPLSKKAAHQQHWSLANLKKATAGFLSSSLGVMRHEYGDPNIAAMGESGRIVSGVPLPSLAFEYLIQNTVFPLNRITQLVGTEGSFKSALTFEIVRWFRKLAGIGMLFENESKYSSDFANSIIGWDDPDAMGHVPCTSMDDWQHKMLFWFDEVHKMMDGTKENPGSGRIWPALGILDSLMGKLAESTIKDMVKAGHAERRYALEAMMITDYFKKIPSDIETYPIALITVNHLKKSKDERGMPVRGKPGGKHVSFQETFELEMSKAFNSKFRYAADEKNGIPQVTGRRLNIACYKNSLGETDRDIDVDIMWWRETFEGGIRRQVTAWDWYGANTKLLLSFEGGEARRINDIVDMHKVAVTGQPLRVWSTKLGISQKAPVSYAEAGELIQKDKKILNALRNEFGIKVRKVFQPGVDYRDQLAVLHDEAEILSQQAEDDAFSAG